jgi:short-subunit dehydrogenase
MTKAAHSEKALITGASSGIGRAFALMLAESGVREAVLVARDEARLAEVAEELAPHGCRAEVLVADLKNPADLERVADRLRTDTSVDLLVNNAGYGVAGNFIERDRDVAQGQIDLNVTALTRLAHAAATMMAEQGHGGIINIASGAAFLPSPMFAVYSATKAYVVNLSLAMREELATSGVRVLVVCPGFTRTEFQQRADYDTSSLPSFIWQSAEQCVAESLSAYDNDEGMVITGVANRWTMRALSLVPKAWIGGLAGRVTAGGA